MQVFSMHTKARELSVPHKTPEKWIVISLSKIRDRDWSYTRHVMQRCSGQQYRSTLPVNITGQYYQQDRGRHRMH